MKYLFLLLVSFPFFANAQDNDTCKLKRTRDAYTKEIRLSTGFFKGDFAKISIEADKNEIDIFFNLGGNSSLCFDDESTALVFFANSRQKTNYKNNGTMNCDGYFHMTFKNSSHTLYSLQKLASMEADNIVFTSGKTVTKITLSEEERKIFRQAVSCISVEAKGLLPQQ